MFPGEIVPMIAPFLIGVALGWLGWVRLYWGAVAVMFLGVTGLFIWDILPMFQADPWLRVIVLYVFVAAVLASLLGAVGYGVGRCVRRRTNR